MIFLLRPGVYGDVSDPLIPYIVEVHRRYLHELVKRKYRRNCEHRQLPDERRKSAQRDYHSPQRNNIAYHSEFGVAARREYPADNGRVERVADYVIGRKEHHIFQIMLCIGFELYHPQNQRRYRKDDQPRGYADNDRKPQIVGMCNWLGISRDTLNTWVRGEYRNSTHSDIIKKAVNFIEEMWADYMLNGKLNPASGIFLAKNWYGYKDVADVVVTPNNPMQGLDADTARQRLIESVPDEDE